MTQTTPRLLILLVLLVVPALLFWDTTAQMVAIWNRSETFAHGFIILPISLWLIWQRRVQLAALDIRPCWAALLPLLISGLLWLAADLAEVSVVSQYAVVAMAPLLLLLVMGVRVAREIAFPLLFLLFMVPFGEALIPWLIKFTADFTITAVQLSGVPVLRDGVRFSLPTGDWEVVEACSGLRYLIASFTLGTLYAYLTYRRLWKIALCILMACVVPVLANGVRAYMIVMIGHLSGMQLAVGIDHLIYGWLFFGVVMLAFFWIGNYWREDLEQPPAETAVRSGEIKLPALMAAAGVGVAVLLAWGFYSDVARKQAAQQSPPELQLSSAWPQAQPFTDWQPAYLPPAAQLQQRYQQPGQPAVGVIVNVYQAQNAQHKLISSSNHMAGNDPLWFVPQRTTLSLTLLQQPLNVRQSLVRSDHQSLLVWQFYWINGALVGSDYQGKLRQALQMLSLQGDSGAALVFYTDVSDDDIPAAQERLRSFVDQHLAALVQPLEQ